MIGQAPLKFLNLHIPSATLHAQPDEQLKSSYIYHHIHQH